MILAVARFSESTRRQTPTSARLYPIPLNANAIAAINLGGNFAIGGTVTSETGGLFSGIGESSIRELVITTAGPDIPPPQAVSVTPFSGSGSNGTFTFVTRGRTGGPNLAAVQALFNTAINGVGACYIQADPAHGSVWLANDGLTGWFGNLDGHGWRQPTSASGRAGTIGSLTMNIYSRRRFRHEPTLAVGFRSQLLTQIGIIIRKSCNQAPE